MSKDFGKTLNLPKTEFSMRANLPQREPATKDKWEEQNVYAKMLEKNIQKQITRLLSEGDNSSFFGVKKMVIGEDSIQIIELDLIRIKLEDSIQDVSIKVKF